MFSRDKVRKVLDNPREKYFGTVNDFLSLLTIVSILAIVLETVPSLNVYHQWFLLVEWVAVFFFGLEYLARIWSSRKPLTYIFSFFGLVDLIAILPTILGLGNFSFLKSARVIRIIRFLRLIRISKLAKAEMESIEDTLGAFGFTIAIYAAAVTAVLLILGVTLHIMLPGGEYWSVPKGMYWAFSVFLGGLPAEIPPGNTGLVIYITAKFLGMALFGLLIGVTGKIFNEILLGKIKDKKEEKDKKRR